MIKAPNGNYFKMIIKLSIIVFITQLIFIGCRTWNVRAISDRNLKSVLVSGAFVHLSWLVSIAIGSISMYDIITEWRIDYLPVIAASLSGGLIGSWVGLKENKR